MSQSVKYVGLDVHKETIAVAVAEDGKRSEVREHGEIANTPAALTKLFGKLGGPGVELHICYEAGPCGYGIQRQVVAAGHSCVVVAPSLIPSRPGDRIKTDRRDAVKLARLHRAGELTSVWVPDSAHEAMRDLVRARLAALRSLRHARQQLSGFLLRHGHHYHRPAWTQMHRRWLSGLRFAEDAHHIVLEDCIATIDAAKERRDRLTAQIKRPIARLDLGTGRRGYAGAPGRGACRSGHHRRRTGRHQQVFESRAVDVLSRVGAVRGFQREAAPPGRHHQGRERGGPADADRGGLELPFSGADQQGAAFASGAARRTDPSDRLEGAGTTLPPISKAQPRWQTDHDRHHGHRPPARRLCLGDRARGQHARGVIVAIDKEKEIAPA